MAARIVLALAVIASASAFSAAPGLSLRQTARPAITMKLNGFSPVPSPEGVKETYWETRAPGSQVLGLGKDVSSGNYIFASIASAAIGGFACSQVFPLQDNPNLFLIAATLFLPYSWALHVAAYIQKNNGK